MVKANGRNFYRPSRLSVHMHAKNRTSCWLGAAVVLAVAAYAGVAAARAQSSDYFFQFNASHRWSDKYRKSVFGSLSWERQYRKPYLRNDSSRASPGLRTKSKPEQSEPAASKKAVGTPTATVESVPLPRPRPPSWPEPHSFAEAAGPGSIARTSPATGGNRRDRTVAEAHRSRRLRRPRYD